MNIIVPLDGSQFAERAVSVAATLARRLAARVVLMTTSWNGDSDASQEYLEGVAEQQGDVSIDVLVVNDHPAATAIANAAREFPDAAICMSSHGRGPIRWAVLGSVSGDLVRQSRQPLILVGHHCASGEILDGAHMVVAVDAANAADPVVSRAIQWATALALDVHVAHVLHPLDDTGGEYEQAVLDKIAEEVLQQNIHATVVVLRSSFEAGAIADYARDLPAALVVMNSHARSGVPAFALGSVAMATVGLAQCPVLVSPIPHA